MAWDFETEPDFQRKLDWMAEFVREEVEPLDVLFDEPGAPYDTRNATTRRIVEPLQDEVEQQGLWACHMGPDLGGKGFGQLKLALMNEILGRTRWAPTVFGCQAPDSGNAEILAHYGSDGPKGEASCSLCSRARSSSCLLDDRAPRGRGPDDVHDAAP